MRKIQLLIIGFCILGLSNCAVKLPEKYKYQLSAFSAKRYASQQDVTLMVTAPEATAAYQTQEMVYIKKQYQLESFAQNSWTNPPADMLYPLIVQSLQSSGYFKAVGSSLYSEKTNYRLDTQLIKLEQNFLKNPSVLEFTAKVVLTHVDGDRVIASKVINLSIPCPQNSPYGGVVAANRATLQFTAITTKFVMRHMHSHHNKIQ